MENPLDRAEAIDGYRAKCAASPLNRQARIDQTYALDSIPQSKTSFLQKAAQQFPLLDAAEIAILNSSADGGLPHTRPPNLICLPGNGIPNSPTAEFSETLLHEGIHIHQRLHPSLWERACERAGWKRTGVQLPLEIASRMRLNPDTLHLPLWSWDSHIPLSLFPKGHTNVSLGSAHVVWYDERTGVLHPEPPPSFREKGNKETGSAIEHPYELYAYRFSRRGLRTPEEVQTALDAL